MPIEKEVEWISNQMNALKPMEWTSTQMSALKPMEWTSNQMSALKPTMRTTLPRVPGTVATPNGTLGGVND